MMWIKLAETMKVSVYALFHCRLFGDKIRGLWTDQFMLVENLHSKHSAIYNTVSQNAVYEHNIFNI